jgi:pimeloyl-ACP methyl ester carboxylesterase
MSEPACPQTCSAHPVDLAPIHLADALERCRREAISGVCDTGRYRMPYRVWGEGPPLVFIHGLSDCSDTFVGPMAQLSRQFRCIAYDQPPGHGGARIGSYTHADLVADLLALMDHLGLAQAYLFGSSFGATIALAAMHQQPGRLPRAILQGGIVRRPLRRAERILTWLFRFLPGRMRWLPLREKVLRVNNLVGFENRPPEAWRYFIQCSGRPCVAWVARQALILDRLDLRPILPAIHQPVLLVSGEKDRIVGRGHEEMLLAGLPSAGRATLLGCGHVPSHTHPELLAELVRQFLTPPRPHPETCPTTGLPCEQHKQVPPG